MRTSSELRNTIEEVGDSVTAAAADKRLARVAVENTTLSKTLVVKERLVEELQRHILQKEAECGALKVRFESTEKENAYLKSEYHILVKEVEVQNVELEYYRRSIEAAHMQHLENVQKISKLEAECQRLQRMTKKKQFGSAPFAKVSSDAAGAGRDRAQSRGKSSPAFPHECLSSCLEKLRTVEEENNVLKELLDRNTVELQSSRTMYSRAASRLSQVEAQLTGLTGSHKSLELVRYENAMDSDICSDGSSSVSWANALIAELDHFKGEKKRNQVSGTERIANMNLMDDFVEVEKLAMLSLNGESNHLSAEQDLAVVVHSGCTVENKESNCEITAKEGAFDWLQVVMNAITKQQSISKRSVRELVQDIRIALGCFDQGDSEEGSNGSDQSHAISKLVKLIQETKEIAHGDAVNNPPMEGDIPPEENIIHAFQWSKSELNSAVEQFVDRCSALQARKTNLGSFVEDLYTTLEWLINNHMTPSALEASLRLQGETQKDLQIKESQEIFESQLDNLKIINEDLSSQLSASKAELTETVQKLLSMEIELDDRKNKYEELEGECLELQLVLESIEQRNPPHQDSGNSDKQDIKGKEELFASKDIHVGSQETIAGAGKEMSSLVEGSMLGKNAISNRSYTKRFSLREQLIAEDTGKAIILRTPSEHKRTSSFRDPNGGQLLLVHSPYPFIDSKNSKGDAVIGALVVPSKKEGFGFLRKLIVRKKKAPKIRGSMKSKVMAEKDRSL